jgi:tetratricopeptide (TPR) repeat protein
MTLPRIAVFILALGLGSLSSAWAQGDPLQDANQLFRQGQFDRAMDRVNGYLASRPKDARGRFLKGLILTEQNKPTEAIKVFTDLSQDFPELPEPYNNLAVLYASQGQYDKARNSLEMAIRTHPSYATAHENLGDIYAKMASQAYDKALQLDRSNQAAQGKLNLIKDLFSQTSTSVATRPPGKAAVVAKAEPTPAPVQQPVPPPAAKIPPATVAQAPAAKPAAPAAKAAEPAPAKPAPAKAPAAAPARNPDEVLKAVNGWARAWASNDVPGYLAHYASSFDPPGGMSRSAWEGQRKARIAKPRKIEVQIDDPKVNFIDGNRATVSFRQHYKSGSLDISSNKTLTMMKSGDKWQIQREQVGKEQVGS